MSVEKLQSKLTSMEIAFEIINNDRNRLLSKLEKIKNKLGDRSYYLWISKYDLIADIEDMIKEKP